MGEFDLKEAYNLACVAHDNFHCEPFMANWIWKTSTLPKIRCFLWQCLHRSIQTRKVLGVRGLNISLSCPLCNTDVESIIHILRDCHQVRAFWNSFPPPIHSNLFYGANLLDWLRINYTSHQISTASIPWGTFFTFGVWCLWLRRNKVISRDQTT